MKLGTEVGLGPAIHCVRWGPRSLQRKGHNNPNFRLMSLLWPNGMDGSRSNLLRR